MVDKGGYKKKSQSYEHIGLSQPIGKESNDPFAPSELGLGTQTDTGGQKIHVPSLAVLMEMVSEVRVALKNFRKTD